MRGLLREVLVMEGLEVHRKTFCGMGSLLDGYMVAYKTGQV